MNTHEPGKTHADQNGQESKSVVLFADDLVVEAEDVLAKETLGRAVRVRSVWGNLVHFALSIACSPVVSTKPRNPAPTSHSSTPSCCSDQVRRAACTQSRIVQPWSR